MSNKLCVNKSGKVAPVWNKPGWPNNDSTMRQIGSIYDGEVFGYDANWGGDGVFNHICFRNSAGQLTDGFLINTDANGNPVMDDEYGMVFSDVTFYPYGTAVINGETFKTFKFRRAEEVYTSAGTRWGTVAAGMRVACRSALSGDSHPDWKAINYVERSSDGAWIQVTGDGQTYGYVDSGLNQGSGRNNISMYGTW